MQPFGIEFPTSVEEAALLLQTHGASAKLCAGGTDLLPNLKHELLSPAKVIHLSRLKALKGIEDGPAALVIGAMTSLDDIANSELVKKLAPGLSQAAAHVAGPQLRRMGTLGGNLCLDTRCLYYNQSYFWREALGFCLKKDGDDCHVTKTGKRCVAAASNDCATMLIALDANVDILGPSGTRNIALADFYVANGEKNNVLDPAEILVRVHVPKMQDQSLRTLQGFSKLRHRESIDFPILSIGVRVDVDKEKRIFDARLVVNALAAKPKVIQTDFIKGRVFDEAAFIELGAYASARCTPLSNICDDPTWRKEMIAVYVRRACEAADEL